MTEHCVNHGLSICQTMDATHLILTLEDLCASKTLGFTYFGKRTELEFYLVADTKALGQQLSLHVTNNSADNWHILTYDDPMNNNTEASIKELPAKEDIYLYSIKEHWFANDANEVVIFFRLDRDAAMLSCEEIDQEQLKGLYRRLESLQKDAQFSDMTVNGVSAHRAVVAAASHTLHQTVSDLIFNKQSSTETTTDDDDVDLIQAKEEIVLDTSREILDAMKNANQDCTGDVKENIHQDTLLSLKKILSAQFDEQFVETVYPVVRDMWNTHNSEQIDVEEMEYPQPANYTLEIRDLDDKSKESFLRYLYTGDVEISATSFDMDSLALSKSVIGVALNFNVRGLVSAVELNLIKYLDFDKSNLYLSEILDLSALYGLYNLQVHTIKIIRWSYLISGYVNQDNPTFLKYFIDMQSKYRNQKMCYYPYTVTNISKLNTNKIVFSAVFHICAIPFRLRVRKQSGQFSIYLNIKDVTKPLMLKFDVTIFAEKYECKKMTTQHLFRKEEAYCGWSKFIAWSTLMDPSKGFIKNDSVTIHAYVELL